MKNQALKVTPTLSLLVMLAVAATFAQSSSPVVANIPFNFMVGKTLLPSGEYTVKPLAQAAIAIQSKDTRNCAIVLTMSVQTNKTPETGKLVFNRYGDQYFLSKVWHPANPTGRELFKSRAEIELAKNMKQETTVLIAQK